MRYGVQFEPKTTEISAGVVRNAHDRDVFITKCSVTQQVIGATCLWMLVHHGNAPYRITDGNGTCYELTVKVVT